MNNTDQTRYRTGRNHDIKVSFTSDTSDTIRGTLLDISEGGLAILIDNSHAEYIKSIVLNKHCYVRCDKILGKRQVKSEIRYSDTNDGSIRIGIQFNKIQKCVHVICEEEKLDGNFRLGKQARLGNGRRPLITKRKGLLIDMDDLTNDFYSNMKKYNDSISRKSKYCY